MAMREKLLELLRDVDDEIDYEEETRLAEDGLLDSLSISVITAQMDDIFHVQIRPGEIEPENFNSVDAMLRMLEAHGARL